MPFRIARSWTLLALAGALGGGALAQPAGDDDDRPPLPVPGQVLSDAEMLPAEHRDSAGAVLLHQSPVRALRESADARRTGIATTIGRHVQRIVDRARGWDDVREADAAPALQVPARPVD
ncbi:MAG: hypothetical protein EOO24_32725 [Comamonadaceae bacterium]|nr:MAG: hypothetical protein EOO24_32725 [Comamonadaceae bacterium]